MYPSFQSPNIIRHLRSRGASLNRRAADKLGARPFARGAGRVLMSAGGRFAQLLRAGQWRGNAVGFYLHLSEDARRAIADILIEDSDNEPS